MTPSPLTVLALALGAGLLGLALATDERRRRAPALPSPVQPEVPGDEVTVVVPARDEEENILPCVESLLAQTVRPRVRVIDDGSTDGTAALVAARAAGEPRLTLLGAGPLPPGWRGKANAQSVGARGVESPWLLLTDADTRHDPELLARALAAAAERGLDAVSLAGAQEAASPGENLLVPAVFALLDVLLGDWEEAAGGGPAVANGQFLLLRRAAWESCGSFEAVRGEAIDDLAVVRLLRERGYRTGFLRAQGLRVRMYRGLAATVRGWRRNLGGLFGCHPGRTAAALAGLLLPPLALAGALAAGRWLPAVLLWTAGAAASALLRLGGGHQPAYGLLFPADALLLAWTLACGALDHRRGRLVSWKGREMVLGRSQEASDPS